jgi:hypothetical protein
VEKFEGIDSYSSIERNMDEFEANEALASLRTPVAPFTDKERSQKESLKRLLAVIKDYWVFDETYFTSKMYFGGRAKPNKMIRDIVEASYSPVRRTQTRIEVFLGPRKHGKTVTVKKVLLWLLLTGKIRMAGTYAETLLKSANIMRDVISLLKTNERIQYDFFPTMDEENDDQCEFHCTPDALRHAKLKMDALFGSRFLASFGEGRSVRGYTRGFSRPEFIFADDVETLESSFEPDPVAKRLNKLSEAMNSLEDGSLIVLIGNDIDTRGAMHQLRTEQEQNRISDSWRVHVYKAWDKKALWFDRYPASSEGELKLMLAPKDEADYQANFQMNPIPPDGIYFKREHYFEEPIPADARGIIFTDPNLSKKGRGDSTAITPLLYSPTTDKYYVPMCVCRSFSDSNALLDALLDMKASTTTTGIGLDGNVSQESSWTNNVRNYCRINEKPFPGIEYKKYRVDDLAKNAQLAYAAKRIRFSPGFSLTPDGERFLNQLFAFAGKKASKADDAPDSLISAFEFIHERGVARRSEVKTKSITDYYSLKD